MTGDQRTALVQIQGVLEGESDFIANLANVSAILKSIDGYFWVGFYLVKADQLVLGPFQGPVACTRIAYNLGVCGTAWAENRSILVPDVHAFPGHIACNAASASELVVPLRNAGGQVIGVLDADSDRLNFFTAHDQELLEAVAQMLLSPATVSF